MSAAGLLTALLLLGPAAAPPAAPAGDAADRLLAQLEALEGDWVEVGEDGRAGDEVVLTYRVVAGGHAVMSTEFPGTEHEMITVYHREGEGVAMTHYCALGNRPHMVARSFAGGKAEFECAKGSELDAQSAKHVHHGTFVFHGKDEFESAWVLHDGGEPVWTAQFHVVRSRDF